MTRLDLYNLGYSDPLIAERHGTSRQIIKYWRRCLGLPANVAPTNTDRMSAKDYFTKRGEWEQQKARMRELLRGWR